MRESNTITTSYHLFVLMFKHTYFDSKFEEINQKLFALGWPIKATLINLLSLTFHFNKKENLFVDRILCSFNILLVKKYNLYEIPLYM